MDVWKLRLSPSCCVCSLLELNKLEKLSSFYCKLAGSARVSSSLHSHLHFWSIPQFCQSNFGNCFSDTDANMCHKKKYLLFRIDKQSQCSHTGAPIFSYLGHEPAANKTENITLFFFFFEVKSLVFKLEYTVFKFSLKFVCLPPFSPPVFPLDTVLFHVK